jgi:ketosteroid isomerase-like protein
MGNRILILLLFVSFGAFAQKEADLKNTVLALDKALIAKDSVALQGLLDDEVSYGHSNGWIETKRDVIHDLYNGKLTYKQIRQESQSVKVSGKVAYARYVAELDIEMNGKPIQLKLSVLQVWVWKNKHWTLFARQSTKV